MGAVPAAVPADENERLDELHALEILDTAPEEEFDAIVRLAAQICGVPVATVSLVDSARQWFKAKVGIDVSETSRDVAYCAHAILEPTTMVVPDASKDPRFVDNPLRTGPPHVAFYAGVPLRTSAGQAVGTLCVIDHVPRGLSEAQQVALEALAQQVVRLLELRRAALGSRKDRPLTQPALPRPSMMSLPPVNEKPREWSRAAFVVAFVLVLGTCAASVWVSMSVQAAQAVRLETAAQRAERFLHERTRTYSEILRGAAALFKASERVSGQEFRSYVDALRLTKNYPGVLGLAYVEPVSRGELSAYVESARREMPDFEVTTSGASERLAVVRYVEPIERNRAARGFDMMSDPTRARSLELTRGSNDVVFSGRVALRQDPQGGPGFLFELPLRKRSTAIDGWVYVVVRARDFVSGIEDAAGEAADLTLFDDPKASPLLGALSAEPPAFALSVPVANERMRLDVRPAREFASFTERGAPWAVLVLGLCATALSFALTTAMRRIEVRSQSLADSMTKAIRHGERELRAVIDGTQDFVLAFGDEGYLVLANRAFRKVLGYEQASVYDMSVHDVVHPEAREAFSRAISATPGESSSRYVETTFLSRAGNAIEVEGALSYVPEEGITRAIFRDVSARKQAERALRAANAALEQLASIDGLTGVANRRAFDERLSDEVARARRQQTPLSLLLLDVDHFKAFNDAYGHQGGDDCLRQVGACLRGMSRRATDFAARYGGEEFALLLAGTTGESAAQLGERVRAAIEGLGIVHERHPLGKVTASFGVAAFDGNTMASGKELVEAADRALYRAKSLGRNRVELG